MSPSSIGSLENLSLTELVGLVRGLIGEVERLREDNERLEAALAAAKLESQQLKDDPASEGLAAATADQAVGHGEGDGSP